MLVSKRSSLSTPAAQTLAPAAPRWPERPPRAAGWGSPSLPAPGWPGHGVQQRKPPSPCLPLPSPPAGFLLLTAVPGPWGGRGAAAAGGTPSQAESSTCRPRGRARPLLGLWVLPHPHTAESRDQLLPLTCILA